MKSWSPSNKNNLKVKIDSEGLTKALLIAREAEKRKLEDKEVIVWCHLVKFAMGRAGNLPNRGVYKKVLFATMNHERYKEIFDTAMKRCTTDEVPTQFMKDLYKEFKEWSTKHPRAKRR